MKQLSVCILLFMLLTSACATASETIVFIGEPELKISEGGLDRVIDTLQKTVSNKNRCMITRQNNTFFWKSRGYTKLIKIDSGAFTTYIAENGSGYIRISKPGLRELIKNSATHTNDPEAHFNYVEHLLIELKSITYWGNSI